MRAKGKTERPMHRRASPAAQGRVPAEGEGSLLTREPLLLLALLLAVFYFGRPLLIPLALALTLSFLLTPVVTRMERMRLRRAPAAALVLLGATTLIGATLWLVAGQLLRVVNDLPEHAPNIRAKLEKTHLPADSALGQAFVSVEGLSREFSSDPAQQAAQQRTLAGTAAATATARARTASKREARRHAGQAADTDPELQQPTPVVVVQAPASEIAYLRQLVGPVLVPAGTAGMVLIFAVYMLVKREDLRNRMLLLAGVGRLNVMTHALDDAAARISRYLIANVAVNAGFGVIFAAALYAIGVPYATLWGALLALLRTVPYVGPLLGGALPTLFALIYFPTWWQAASVIALIGLLEILVSNFLEPWLYGAHTGISELALLAMAIVWTLLWGWPGLALSTPLTVCLIVVGRTMPQMSFLHVLLGDDAELAPEARFYDRMLALDHAEAHNIAERFLQERSSEPSTGPLHLYDEVLLPALALAENDRHRGTLADAQASFFLQSTAELVAEMTHYAAPEPALTPKSGEAGRSVAGGIPRNRTGSIDEALAAAPEERVCCPVVCIPASDQADEIAATMLAQLLEAQGHKTLLLPASTLTPALLARLGEEPETTLCISALPPFALAGAQSLYRRLRAELPGNRIVLGLWRSRLTPEMLEKRVGLQLPQDCLVTNLAEALQLFRATANAPQAQDPFRRAK